MLELDATDLDRSDLETLLFPIRTANRLLYEERKMPKIGTTSKLAPSLASKLREKPVRSDLPRHLIVRARAGTGKTFTLVAGVVNMFRDRVPGIWGTLISKIGFEPVPSPQQKEVWDSMAESGDTARTVQFTAFNKSIVGDFESKWSWVIEALRSKGITFGFNTNHSMGFSAVRRTFPRITVNQYRTQDLISSVLGIEIRELRREKPFVLSATEELVGLCKMNLVNPTEETLNRLVSHYSIEFGEKYNRYGGNQEEKTKKEVFSLVPQILELAKDPKRDGCINYDDMIWLPVVLGLPISKFDVLLVDEAQDLNKAQQQLVKRAGKRLILCGDDRQAIYGFAGADTDGLDNMAEEMGDNDVGSLVLPLTMTRRCGKAIVSEARKIVDDFEAHESNRQGTVSDARYPIQYRGNESYHLPFEETYVTQVQDGDMIICRVNAPLVSQCFLLLRLGKKANIQGRNIGEGLISTVKKMDAVSIADLVGKVSDWVCKEVEKENAKRNPDENKLISIQDRADCILTFTEGATSVEDVIRKISDIFTDVRTGGGVKLSSVHRAKGMEAKRVFVLQPKGASMPHPMAKTNWAQAQEMNIKYVALTRAIEELVMVY